MEKKSSDTDKDFLAVRPDHDKSLTFGQLRNAILYASARCVPGGGNRHVLDMLMEGLAVDMAAEQVRIRLIEMIKGMSSSELDILVERIRDKP